VATNGPGRWPLRGATVAAGRPRRQQHELHIWNGAYRKARPSAPWTHYARQPLRQPPRRGMGEIGPTWFETALQSPSGSPFPDSGQDHLRSTNRNEGCSSELGQDRPPRRVQSKPVRYREITLLVLELMLATSAWWVDSAAPPEITAAMRRAGQESAPARCRTSLFGGDHHGGSLEQTRTLATTDYNEMRYFGPKCKDGIGHEPATIDAERMNEACLVLAGLSPSSGGWRFAPVVEAAIASPCPYTRCGLRNWQAATGPVARAPAKALLALRPHGPRGGPWRMLVFSTRFKHPSQPDSGQLASWVFASRGNDRVGPALVFSVGLHRAGQSCLGRSTAKEIGTHDSGPAGWSLASAATLRPGPAKLMLCSW